MTWSLVGSCGNTPVNIVDFDSVKVSFPQSSKVLKGLQKREAPKG